MNRSILVVNAGSSSIKFAPYTVSDTGGIELVADGQLDGIGAQPKLTVTDAAGSVIVDRSCPSATDHHNAFAEIQHWLHDRLDRRHLLAVGHRVVHGGEQYAEPVRIDAQVMQTLEELVPLAPLHQPHSLAVIHAVKAASPETEQVACFDTAFHRSQPPLARNFALPRALTETGVRRYGFHGLSYEYIASVLPDVAPTVAAGRVVVAHLGNGASLCALHALQSVATTMGFSALDGLVMGTRCGALDPGVLLYLMDQRGMDARALERLLYHDSGLLGVSGLSSDMRALLASDDPHAREAVDLFVYRIGRELGSMAAAIGGLDALVFTGGIGENAAEIRARVCRDARWLGIELDEPANASGGPCISRGDTQPSAWVVRTDENLMIARHTLRLVEGNVR